MKKRNIFLLLGIAVVTVSAGAAYVLTQPSATDTFTSVAAAIGSEEAANAGEAVEPPREIISGVWAKIEDRGRRHLSGFDTPAVVLDRRSAVSGYSKSPSFGFECYPRKGRAPWEGLVARILGVWLPGSVDQAKELPVFVSIDNESAVPKTFVVADSRDLLLIGGEEARALLEQLSNAQHVSFAVPGQTVQFELEGLETISSELLTHCPAENSPKPTGDVVINEADRTEPPLPPLPN